MKSLEVFLCVFERERELNPLIVKNPRTVFGLNSQLSNIYSSFHLCLPVYTYNGVQNEIYTWLLNSLHASERIGH
jgi:hypothetical protein